MKIITAVFTIIFCIPALCIGEEFEFPKDYFQEDNPILAEDFNKFFGKIADKLLEISDLQKGLEDEITALKKSLEEVEKNMTPEGTVAAFESDECPNGWKDYKPAYGRFIRGIDRSGKTIDSEGMRTPGSFQEDDFKSHHHQYYDIYWSEYKGNFSQNLSGTSAPMDDDNKGYQMLRDSKDSGGKETRPKNVSLLYCIKE